MLIQDPDVTAPEEPATDTQYEDIFIPVPYDPRIPGVRCLDRDHLETVGPEHVVISTTRL